MKHAATRMIFSYWDTLRGERAAPERGEIEPGEIRHVLADTFILEIAGDREAVFRLAGTRLCALFGRELKGTAIQRLWAEAGRREAIRHLDTVLDETAGVVAGLEGVTAEGETLDLELIMLPLRHRGRPNARVLGALSPASIPPWLGFHPITSVRTTTLRIIWPNARSGFGEDQAAAETWWEPAAARRRRFVVHQGGRR